MPGKNRSSVNDEQKKNLLKEQSLQQISLTKVEQFWQNWLLFSDRKPLFFRSLFEKDEKTYKFFSKQMFVFKLILRTRRKQCRQLSHKKLEETPINLRSMSENDGRKNFLTEKISPQTGAIDKQKAVLTTRPTKIRRNDKKN